MGDCGVLLEKFSRPMSEKERQVADARREGRAWLRKSRQIALSVLYYLEKKDMSKKDLADRMGVAPSYIGKILKGKENFTLETISKMEEALGEYLMDVSRPYVQPKDSSSWTAGMQSYA